MLDKMGEGVATLSQNLNFKVVTVMEYTSDLERRVQQGRGDTNPRHDVMKLRIDKGKYLYIVPSPIYDGRFEFCSTDAFIQSKMREYKTQVLKKKFLGFKVLDRVKSDLSVTDDKRQNAPQPVRTADTSSKLPFAQPALAGELKKLRNLDLQTIPAAEMSGDAVAGAINLMEVTPNRDADGEYIFKNKEGKEYKLKITNNNDNTLSAEFGPFSFSAELSNAMEEKSNGALSRVFDHELKQGVHATARY